MKPPPADRVEDRIRRAAHADLQRVGPERFTVVAVAKAAGMTHANVYRFFDSKTALLDSVLAAWTRSLETRLVDIADAPDPADDKLERLLTHLSRAYFGLSLDESSLFRLLAEPVAGARESQRHHERVQGLVAQILEEGAATRVFPRADQRRGLALVFDLAHRFIAPAAIAAFEVRTEGTIAVRRDRVIRMVIRALTQGL